MVIVNGKVSKAGKVVLDSGFNYGRGVFETILVRSEPLFLNAHLERLNRGLEELRLNIRVDAQYVLDLMALHDIRDCVMKIVATEKNIVLSTRPVTYKPEDYVRGFKVKLSRLRRNIYSHTTYIKSLNYTDNLLEKEQATAEGFDEVLFFNTNQELAEGSMSNIFAVIDGKIVTPSVDCGLLDGVIRRWVMEHFDVIEDQMPLEALMTAQEVFLTNSVMGIMKVSSIGGFVYEEGPVYRTVLSKYEEFINNAK